MKSISLEHTRIRKIRNGKLTDIIDELAVEEPLEIQLLYGPKGNRIQKNISVTMRTPGNDEELGIGFLFTEGVIQNNTQVSEVSIPSSVINNVLITLCENEMPMLNNTERNFYTTSSCGVCGKSSIDAIRTKSVYENTTEQINLKADLFYGLPHALRKQQEIFSSTGGLHAAALFEFDGNLKILREDIGRHNALDKVIGSAFLDNKLPLTDKILLLSGRASFELIQKAEMAGIRIVAAIGAPSSLAVQLAKDSGITLIGFLRNDSFNIYSGEQRIKLFAADLN